MAGDVPDNVPSRAHGIIVAAIVCSCFSTLFVAVRIWTRVFVNRAVGWDDYAAVITLPFTIAYGVLLGIATRHGMGLHTWDISPSLKIQYSKWIFISSCLYWVALLGYKFAILLLYLRIFNISRTFKYLTWGTMFFVFGYLFCNFLTLTFGCTPTGKYWNPAFTGHCINEIQADYAYGSMNFISDLIMFILPLPMIWRLQLSRRQKVGVSVILMAGSVNWIVAIVRFAWAVEDLTAADRTWLAARTFLWSILEVNTGLICGCVPVLNSFFKRVLPKNWLDRTLSHFKTKSSRSWGTDGTENNKVSQKAFVELERGESDSGKNLVRLGNVEFKMEQRISDEGYQYDAT